MDSASTLADPHASGIEKVEAVFNLLSPIGTNDLLARKLPKPPIGPGSVPKSQRDPKRLFTPSERQTKRAEQGDKCANGCGTDIDASNSVGHHVKRHADGGQTVSENHAEVCVTCHKDLHSEEEK